MHDRLFDVRDKVIVITGVLGQLGTVFANAFLERGAVVVGLDIEATPARISSSFANRAADDRFIGLVADVTDRAQLETALLAIRSRLGVPDVLVNNAALDVPPGAPPEEAGPFEAYPRSAWDRVLAVNLTGVFQCCQVFGAAMADQGRGSIINISSIYGMVSPNQRIYEYRREEGAPFFKPAAYAASKSGVLNLTRYLATYWAPRVRVNTVTFAGVFNKQDARFLESYTAMIPIGRMANVDEYVGPLVFLSSDASSYMTGGNLVVDGGWTAW
jgi:NAD(P)-dependent dehydrogenase (short-subunit alcohol dehydrogenase family)